MSTYYLLSDSLDHHGVKGMKWGVRKDRTSSGRSTKKVKAQKPMNSFQKHLYNDYKKRYEMTDAEAEAAARERSRQIRNVVIGAAAVTGVALATTAAVKYGRMYGDDIIRAGTTMQTVHANPNIINTGKFYTTNRKLDKIKYMGLFGEASPGVPKTKITAGTSKNIKSAGVKNATKIFDELTRSNKDFADAIRDRHGKKIDYIDFNKAGLLGDGRYAGIKNAKKAQKIFFDELKKRGYGAVADYNDRVTSGFGTHANIVFDTSSIKNVTKSRVSISEVSRSKSKATGLLIAQGLIEDKALMAAAGAVGGAIAISASSNRQKKKLKKTYKTKTTKSAVQNNTNYTSGAYDFYN